MTPPDYTFDAGRLAALDDFAILDTPPEQGFDDIVQLAAYICRTPVSLVSFVAGNRQWFKARVGFAPSETDLNSSVCAHALVEPDLLVIEDLQADPRTKNNPLVTGEPHIRFYAGAPLRTASGETVGSLCVIDGKPRPQGLTASQAEGLRNLSRQVMTQLNLRRALAERDLLIADGRRAELRRNGLLAIGDRLRATSTVAEATHAAAEIVGETLGASRAGFGRIDPTGEFLVIEKDWTAPGFPSLAGRIALSEFGDLRDTIESGDGLIIEDVATDTRASSLHQLMLSQGTRSIAEVPVRERGRTGWIFAHSVSPRAWTPEDLTFLRNVGDRVGASVARSEAEARQRVLNQELSHRMKNTMAMVQAIANQTLRSIPDQTPVQSFEARLQALATAHEALLQRDWVAANISDIVDKVLGNVQILDRFTISGPSVYVVSQSVISIALVLHELCTNAMKYGALSTTTGHVDVAWSIADDRLIFTWREAGGPELQESQRSGFGSRLIRLGLAGTGGATLRYLPAGFEADFEASLSQLQRQEEETNLG